MDKKGYILIGSSEESKKILVDLLTQDVSCMRFGGEGEPGIDDFKDSFMRLTLPVPASYLVLDNVEDEFELINVMVRLKKMEYNPATHKPYLAEKNIIVCSCTFNELRELKSFDYLMNRYAVIDTDLPVTKALTDYLKNKKN
ncbi:hypothetical protein [Sphingobacterium siyangense]|uniref:hypothetical protein n=1 Tax=Sphingobacterium siyangense TaxID=459529 RepID=UPI0031F8CDCC